MSLYSILSFSDWSMRPSMKLLKWQNRLRELHEKEEEEEDVEEETTPTERHPLIVQRKVHIAPSTNSRKKKRSIQDGVHLYRDSQGSLWEQIKDETVLPTFPHDVVMLYFDAIISVASVLLFGSVPTTKGRTLLISLLSFVTLTVYWINVRHFLQFTERLDIFQTWCMAFIAMCMAILPYALEKWYTDGDSSKHTLLNGFACLLEIGVTWRANLAPGNTLFRLYVYVAPRWGILWFGAAIFCQHFDCTRVVADGIIWVAPLFFLIPLGGQAKDDGYIRRPSVFDLS